jgi:hypothetical protein
MRVNAGLSRGHCKALIELMGALVGMRDVDLEVRRRAQYLKWALEGYEPGEQPLDFIADAPPLVPETPATRQTAAG